MKNTPTVCAALIRSYFELLIQAGANPIDVEKTVGLSLNQLAEPDERIALSYLVKLEQESPELTKNPAIALEIGQICPPDKSQSGIVGHIAALSSTLGDGFQQAIRYSNLLSDSIHIELREGTEYAEFVYNRVGLPYFTIQSIEFALTNTVTLLRMADEDNFYVSEAHFQYPAPTYQDSYHKVFGNNLFFGQNVNKIVFSPVVLKQQSPRTETYVRDILIKHASDLLEKIAIQKPFSKKVQEKLIDDLPLGPVSIEKAASDLNMSRQTLYRRLREENTSFQELMDRVRKDLAAGYLKSKLYNINEVAFLLGFSEASSFNRAFKRWYDTSPKMFKSLQVN